MREQRWTYYIFYRDDGEVYAYTDDKELSKKFYTERSHQKFLYKHRDLSSKDIKELHEFYPEAVLKMVTLSNVPLALTMMEQITVAQYTVHSEVVAIPLIAKINPEIFTDRIQKALKVIGYVDAYNFYHNGGSNNIELDPLLVFVHLYKDTLNWSKGGGLLESVSILLNGFGDNS